MHLFQIDGLLDHLNAAGGLLSHILAQLPRDGASFVVALLHTFDYLAILRQQRHGARILNEYHQSQGLRELNNAMQVAQAKPFLS